MRLALTAVLLLAQDPDVDRLVLRLGDNDLAVREEAAQALRELGSRAESALRRARESSDAEVRARAAELLVDLDRERAQQAARKEQRPRKLRLVTLDLSDAPIGDALRALGAQTGIEFDAPPPPADRRVTLKVRETPLLEALNRIGLGYRYEVAPQELRVQPPIPHAVYVPGARFSFSVAPWAPQGKTLGFILETHVLWDHEGGGRWQIASVKAARDLEFQTCALHSPWRVFVADPAFKEAVVTIRGASRWSCDLTHEFKAPREGEAWRAGPYRLELRWPHVIVKPDAPVPAWEIGQVLSESDIQAKVKPGREMEDNEFRSDRMFKGKGSFERFRKGEPAWCGCTGAPAAGPLPAPVMVRDCLVKVSDFARYALADLDSLTIRFHLPVDEPFEAVSPTLGVPR